MQLAFFVEPPLGKKPNWYRHLSLLTLAVLAATSLLAVLLADRLLREVHVLQAGGPVTAFVTSDGDSSGRSSARFLEPERAGQPLRWDCELRAGHTHPYCNMVFRFDLDPTRGIDLSRLTAVRVWLRYTVGHAACA